MSRRHRVAIAVSLSLVAILSSGCGEGPLTQVLPAGRAAARIDAIAAGPNGLAVYFVGLRFEGMPIAFIHSRRAPRDAAVGYGTCHLPKDEGGCPLPLVVSTKRLTTGDFRAIRECHRHAGMRGVPTVIIGGGSIPESLGLFTGDPLLLVQIDVTDLDLGWRVVHAVRPVTNHRPAARLVPPSADDRTHIDQVCGPASGQPGTGSRDYDQP